MLDTYPGALCKHHAILLSRYLILSIAYAVWMRLIKNFVFLLSIFYVKNKFVFEVTLVDLFCVNILKIYVIK